MAKKNKGLKPVKRPTAESTAVGNTDNKLKDGREAKNIQRIKKGIKPRGNQWEGTEQQLEWLKYYMDPNEEETYGKPYHAAIKAGYSDSYAKVMMTNSFALGWVRSAKNIMRTMNPEHIRDALENIALDKMEKTSDRIQALKMLGNEQGMFVQKQVTAHIGLEDALRDLE